MNPAQKTSVAAAPDKQQQQPKSVGQKSASSSSSSRLFLYVAVCGVLLAVAAGVWFTVSDAPDGGSGVQQLFTSHVLSLFSKRRTAGRGVEEAELKSDWDSPPPLEKKDNRPDGEAEIVPGKRAPRATFTFTLEEYSDRFVATDREKAKGDLFFRCGTRVSYVSGQQIKAEAAGASSAASRFPSLRVVLSSQRELDAHTKQKWNVAAQRIRLSRFGDDYCDCDDGTDELTTNACSMNNIVTPLSNKRYTQRRAANREVKLYDDDLVNGNPAKSAADEGTSAKGKGAPSDERVATSPAYESLTQEQRDALRLRQMEQHTRLGGPVLPFVCADDPTLILAPSRVNDGVVDCCDGSDESRQEVRDRAKHLRQELLAAQSGASNWMAEFAEHEIYAALRCEDVRKEKLRRAMNDLRRVRAGHKVYQERVENGWNVFGREYTYNATRNRQEMESNEPVIEEWYANITSRMERRKVRSPQEAGIHESEINAFTQLASRMRALHTQIKHHSVLSKTHALGEHFEYYPLYHIELPPIPSTKIVDSTYHLARNPSKETEYDATFLQEETFMSMTLEDLPFTSFSVAPFFFSLAHIAMKVGRRPEDSGAMEDDMERDALGFHHAQQPLLLGNWIPFVEESVYSVSMIDPAGDTRLSLLLNMLDGAPIRGGHGQTIERVEKRKKVIMYEKTSESSKKETATVVPFAHHTPYSLAVHVFRFGGECVPESETVQIAKLEADRILAQRKQSGETGGRKAQESENDLRARILEETRKDREHSSTRVVYMCAEEDKIVEWYRNGRCRHEVLVGTPSACMPWVLQAAEKQVNEARRIASQRREL